MIKAANIVASTVFLAAVSVVLFAPHFRWSEKPKRIELNCRPPLSLLRWWDYEQVWEETQGGTGKPATIHARYVFQGEPIATRQELGQLRPNDREPWVTWRGPGASGKLQINVNLPGRVSAAEYARWQEWVRQCESPQEVEFQVAAPSLPATSGTHSRATPIR